MTITDADMSQAHRAYTDARAARGRAISAYRNCDGGLFRAAVRECIAHANDGMVILGADTGYGGLLQGDGQYATAARCALDIVEPLFSDPLMEPVAIEHLQDALQPLGDALGLPDTKVHQRASRRRDRARAARAECLQAKAAYDQALADLKAARQVQRDAETDYHALWLDADKHA